jgi:hypothetical protein
MVLLGCGGSNPIDAPTSDGGMDAMDGSPDEGEAAPTQCPRPSACGGNLLGTWNVTSTCLDVDLSSYTADCSSFSARAVDYKITGTLTYYDDLTYTLVGTMSGSVVLTLPAPCLTPRNGIQISCAQLEPALLAPGKYESVTCAVATSGCVCKLDVNTVSLSDNGTFTTTEAGVLTETDPAGDVDLIDYCVTNDTTVTLSPPPRGAKLAEQGVSSGSITLTRQ